ncbi:alpha 1,6-mannosyltransferase [Exophiala aquamarina CBS 119918]|uniref:Alpha 1,6-mannosyltransferase n=1 Tax=Exophiala aquamarina CBS 119918 TaxID=1182545 RepID=A0A072P9H2_9EURO|nr:alpha 1,6-mannosyltransferase [Exophiala aquamarina CBS 119918]KEF55918.1 alpha 1,6-mannosyltransferase [Exophiala aquamarina CBS 119918]
MSLPLTARKIIFVFGALLVLLVIVHHGANARFHGQNPTPYPPPDFGLKDLSALSLQRKLEYHFSYDIDAGFPKYIWQTWKHARDDENFDQDLKRLVDSWDGLNPEFSHTVIPDEAAFYLIKKMYISIPEIVQAYQDLPLPILKADFFRYLMLLARGGVYTDVDTEALQGVRNWVPAAFNQSTVGIVIGIEADPDRDDWAQWYARRIQFCQWTIMSKPGHPILINVVERITNITNQMKKDGRLNKAESDKVVLEHTGPGVWTDAVFAYFNDPVYFDTSSINVTNSDFFNLREPKRLGDTVILPITSFSPAIGHMGAEGTEHPLAFVRHAFRGMQCTWKDKAELTRIGSWRPHENQRGGP